MFDCLIQRLSILKTFFNRLFWKVFLALWVSSLAVMLVTVLVIGEIADKDNIRSKIAFKVRLEIEQFVERYEGSEKYRDKVAKYKKNHPSHRKSRWPMLRDGLPLMSLHDSVGRKIFGPKTSPKGEKVTLQVTSQSGEVYQIAYYLRHNINGLSRWQTFIFSVQALLILLSSTVASLLVSFIVVRPMNELTKHVQRLKEGELSVRIVEKLSKRGDEIGDFSREFNQMAEYVESTLVGQQQLFQNVSHELRAPLARLLAASGIIEQQMGQQNPALDRIQLECERLSKLIDELLALAKLQQQEQLNSSLAICPIIEKIVADSQFSQPNREIDFVVTKNSQCYAQGSVALLERAVGNVLGNCLKHTDETVNITVTLSNPDNRTLLISIADNGPGVPQEALARICEPFMRLDTNVQGHGLGLGIARQAMQVQQGGLFVENLNPHGLCVNLTLRLV